MALEPDIAGFNPLANMQIDAISGADTLSPFEGMPVLADTDEELEKLAPFTLPGSQSVEAAEEVVATPAEAASGLAPTVPPVPDTSVDAVSGGELPSAQASEVRAPLNPYAQTEAPARQVSTEPLLNPYNTPEDRARQSTQEFVQFDNQKKNLLKGIADIDAQIAAETDPQKRQQLMAQRREMGTTYNELDKAQKQAAENADMAAAESRRDFALAKTDAELQQAETQKREIQRINAERQRKEEARQAKLANAEREAEQSIQRQRDLLARGPKLAAAGSAFADVISEAFRATLENRVPDFSAAAERAWRRNRELYAEEIDRASRDTQLTGDVVRDIAAKRDLIIAEEQAAKAAMFEQAAATAQLAIQRAKTPMERAQAEQGMLVLLQQRDAAKRASAAKRVEMDRKQDKYMLERNLLRAKAAKEWAGAEKLQADTRLVDKKTRRVGSGGRRAGIAPGAQGLIERNQVAFPGSDEIAFTIGDPKNPKPADIKQAQKLRKATNYYSELLFNINALESSIEDADEGGVFGDKFDRTGEWTDLQSRISNLVPEIAKIGSGGFAATDTDQTWAEKNLPTTPSFWNTKEKSLKRIRALKARVQERARFALSGEGVKPEKAETFVSRMEKYSVSGRDIAKSKMKRAKSIVQDEKAPIEERVVALDSIEEKARKDASDIDADWLPRASNRLIAAVQTTSQPEVVEAAQKKVDKYLRFAEERANNILSSNTLVAAAVGSGTGDKLKGTDKIIYQRYVQAKKLVDKLRDAQGRLKIKRGLSAVMGGEGA